MIILISKLDSKKGPVIDDIDVSSDLDTLFSRLNQSGVTVEGLDSFSVYNATLADPSTWTTDDKLADKYTKWLAAQPNPDEAPEEPEGSEVPEEDLAPAA